MWPQEWRLHGRHLRTERTEPESVLVHSAGLTMVRSWGASRLGWPVLRKGWGAEAGKRQEPPAFFRLHHGSLAGYRE